MGRGRVGHWCMVFFLNSFSISSRSTQVQEVKVSRFGTPLAQEMGRRARPLVIYLGDVLRGKTKQESSGRGGRERPYCREGGREDGGRTESGGSKRL